MKDDIGVSVKLIESEYDNEKLFCALCCGHVDKKVFAETFNKNTLSKGLVDISEDDVHHHFAQERCALARKPREPSPDRAGRSHMGNICFLVRV